ncbi:MAG: hypothetical protein JNM56_11205 [Planctomycetia bacterium]|nr:hypothetical protein [Planctomycetia bacterium]
MTSELLLLVLLAPAQASDVPAARPVEVREERTRTLEKTVFAGTNALTVKAVLQGPAVKQAAKFGNIKVSEARDDTDADLIVKGDSFNATNQPELKPISDFNRKDDQLTFDLRLQPPARAAKSVTVKGTVDLIVGGTRVNADFPKVKALANTELNHAELAALGVKLKLAKIEKSINYTMEGNEAVIEEIVLLDKAGKKIESQGRGSFRLGKGPKTFDISFGQPIDADATLRITLLKGAKQVAVPFTFDKLQLP